MHRIYREELKKSLHRNKVETTAQKKTSITYTCRKWLRMTVKLPYRYLFHIYHNRCRLLFTEVCYVQHCSEQSFGSENAQRKEKIWYVKNESCYGRHYTCSYEEEETIASSLFAEICIGQCTCVNALEKEYVHEHVEPSWWRVRQNLEQWTCYTINWAGFWPVLSGHPPGVVIKR